MLANIFQKFAELASNSVNTFTIIYFNHEAECPDELL